MGSKKKITKTSLQKAINSISNGRMSQVNVLIGNEEICVDVKRYLTSQEEISCVSSIVDSVMIDGEYKPEVIEAAYMMNYLMAYTNIDISVGVESVYKLRYETELFDKCFDISDLNQWGKICSQAERTIKYRNETEMFGAKKALDILMEKFEQISEALGSVSKSFDAIDSDTVEKAINKLAAIDDKKIIEMIAESKK